MNSLQENEIFELTSIYFIPDQRSKSYNALNQLLRGSVTALEPDAVASVSASNCKEELKAVKIANNNLQQCVDKLQSMVRS